MLRRAAPVALACAVAACGAAPTSPAPLPSFQLSAGRQSLNISISQVIVINPIGFTSSQLVCTGTGPGAINLPVDVTRDGDDWIARAVSGTLRLRLTAVNGGVRGTLEGAAAQSGITVTINDGQPAPAVLPSTTFSGAGVGGPIEGTVRFDTAQGSQSCSSNSWTIYGPR